jgi:hypothetical protein
MTRPSLSTGVLALLAIALALAPASAAAFAPEALPPYEPRGMVGCDSILACLGGVGGLLLDVIDCAVHGNC